MGNIRLLDCTLRDGGYINDWRFGESAIRAIIDKSLKSKVDILEIGFLKNEEYFRDRTVFSSMDQIADLIAPKQAHLQYAAMIEVVNPPPLENIQDHYEGAVDIIRVIIWKKLLKEGFDYCKAIVEKGYKLYVQPARVDQYTPDEFVEMLKLYSSLNPSAIYVVDSFGTQNKSSIFSYLKLADTHLKPEIALGYHGHNNLLQAFGIAEAFTELALTRDIVIDASIYGMGRGAGNLNLEIFAKFLNETKGSSYNIQPMLEIFDAYLTKIFDVSPWGYSLPFFLTALYKSNPNYASFYGLEKHLPNTVIDAILRSLSEEDKIIFTQEKAEKYLEKYNISSTKEVRNESI